MSELKPCPFCGGKPNRVIHNDNPNWWQYECPAVDSHIEVCNIAPMGHIYDTQHEAAAAWNTRAVPDVPELVRYAPVFYDDDFTAAMEESDEGEYVLHSQVAEIITEERSEKHRAQESVLKLERELAQYEAQEAVPAADLKAEVSKEIDGYIELYKNQEKVSRSHVLKGLSELRNRMNKKGESNV